MESWKAELYHHGVQGQKWGVRRYQNADGSLTAAGKKHAQSAKNRGLASAKDAVSSSASGGGGGGGVEIPEELDGYLDDDTFDEMDEKIANELDRLGGDTDEMISWFDGSTEKPRLAIAEVLGIDTYDWPEEKQNAIANLAVDMVKKHGGSASHSDSSKAYVGSLGMKWKINR